MPRHRRVISWLRGHPWLALLGLIVLGGVVTAGAWWQAPRFDHTRIYRIGFGNDVPLHFPDADGHPAGLAVELVQESARRQGIRLEWVSRASMSATDLNLWVVQSVRPWHTSTLHYTEPYLQAESCFLVLDGSPVRDLPDLAGHRISYVNYAVHRETLPRILADFEPVPTSSSREAVDAMIAGRADAAYIDQYTLFSTLLNGSQARLRVLPTRSPTRELALAARPDYAAVADALREGMQSLVVDGTLARTMQRWVFFPNFTANIIGDSAQERRRIRWLIGGIGTLSVLLVITIGVTVLAQRRKNQWQRSEQKYRELHESMTDAYVRFDLQWRIIGTNPAFCDLLGWSEPELLQRSDRELTPSRWHNYETGIVRADVMRRGFSAVYEKEYLRRNGAALPVESRVFLLRDDAGQPSGMWAIVRDITERKLAEAERDVLQGQLAQAQKLEVVGRLAGGVAHDFNNMLQAILGNVNLAMIDLPAPHPGRDSLEEIRHAAERSADLTRQLLAFARKQTIAPKVLDLNETIEGTLKLVRRIIGEGIALSWQPGANLWPVRIDPGQLDQILTNLCVNARDALNGTGWIRLESANLTLDAEEAAATPGLLPGDFVMLAVSDNGAGMDEDTKLHLFEPFFTTKETGKGTGLGLATVYGIVSQNQGGIHVQSTLGAGSTFRIYLPRHRAPVPPPSLPATAGTTPRGHETILLVEDEAPVLRVGQRLLTNLGYRVLAALSPTEALHLARTYPEPIHLLLTDVIMPEMNGRELAAQIGALHPHMKRMFISGYDANVIATHGVLEPGIQFLQKPYSAETLAAAVRTALAAETASV